MSEQPCKLFVAAYDPANAIVVFAEPQDVHEIVSTASCNIADVFDDHDQMPPSDGLWMFEGTLTWTDEEDGSEARFEGTWRRPTDVEALAAARGENPCLDPCGT